MAGWWHRLLKIPLEEVGFRRRGFRGGSAASRAHIEKIGVTFLTGYHQALAEPRHEALARALDSIDDVYRGFAFEGAAMALTLVDAMSPGRAWRLNAFLAGSGAPHVYMAHVGAGWAIARLPLGMERILRRLDPMLRWLALDGYGFHQGYFHWPRAVEGRQEIPRRLIGYARRAFDQGLGRSLWFVDGADVQRIPATIASFPPSRRADLWSGVGLACTYAGGIDRTAVEALRAAGRGFAAELAQGAAFAVKARLLAGNPTRLAETACRILCRCGAEEAAAVSDQALVGLPHGGEPPAYETWRQRVRDRLMSPGTAGG